MQRGASPFNIVSVAFGLAFLYLPISILVIYSFNVSRLVTVWGGWSLVWYRELLNDAALLQSAWISLRVGVLSATAATILGTPCAGPHDCHPAARLKHPPAIGPADWPIYNRDVLGTRHNPAEKALGQDNVGKLVEKWRFPPPACRRSVGVVHGHRSSSTATSTSGPPPSRPFTS